jgi:A/G-specific adenine glycosylase
MRGSISTLRMTRPTIPPFQSTVWQHYNEQGRHDLPWRQPELDGSFDPYKILVSELMLQQTQVPRVIPKFVTFVEAYPSFKSLAIAPLSDVLKMWSGLGYNRRAKFLLQTAQLVTGQYSGKLPMTHADLVALPGVGNNTAGAIRAYAFNEPVVFVETNIRTVFIHHFFNGQEKVPDSLLMPLIQECTPPDCARTWYWALMDYGTHLKQTVGNVSQSSSSYAKQTPFHGSRRRIRGQVLRLLADGPHTLERLDWKVSDERLQGVLDDLVKEGFIELVDSHYQLRS